jgi:hypothetical protein
VVRTLFVQIHKEVSPALVTQVSQEMACFVRVSFEKKYIFILGIMA